MIDRRVPGTATCKHEEGRRCRRDYSACRGPLSSSWWRILQPTAIFRNKKSLPLFNMHCSHHTCVGFPRSGLANIHSSFLSLITRILRGPQSSFLSLVAGKLPISFFVSFGCDTVSSLTPEIQARGKKNQNGGKNQSEGVRYSYIHPSMLVKKRKRKLGKNGNKKYKE